MFQFTLPCRERLAQSWEGECGFLFQFTLPCRERQADALALAAAFGVSIHAPV